jgi:hypothetical protein
MEVEDRKKEQYLRSCGITPVINPKVLCSVPLSRKDLQSSYRKYDWRIASSISNFWAR